MGYDGSCHCGAVTFSIATDPPAEAMTCNCSRCRRTGVMLAFVPVSAFTLTAGEEALANYRFNTHRIRHRFCRHCGVQPFAEGVMPDGTPIRAVNLRAVPSVDIDALTLRHFDGASV